MMPSFKPKSALDLELEGSIGSFIIGRPGTPASRSSEVMFLQTHVGFDWTVDANDKLLRHLAPVREIFPPQMLDLDQIMQRDIDDARVSTDLIPYLLDERTHGSVKFFPPVVIVVVPVDQTSKPDTRYPKVERLVANHPEHNAPFQYVRSGVVGTEAFAFEFPRPDGRPRHHDYARLKLNTSKVRLVIIDGQHRAMALLALYRNLKSDWSDARRQPFEDYYAQWTKARIAEYQLDGLQLPVIICAFPELDAEFKGELTVLEAARRMFLTLNEPAKKVSRSRNLLMDDQDLVSHFMREALREIKNRDLHADTALRLWNVELDQSGDKQVIDSPVACTGVTHLHYMIEHVLFDDGDVKGIAARSGKFAKRKSQKTTVNLVDRLDGENLLGAEVANDLRRDDYSKGSADALAKSFMGRYGSLLVAAFDRFAPFAIHCKAAITVEASLHGNKNPQIRTILFDGQNINRTFESHREHLQRTIKEDRSNGVKIPPEIDAVLGRLDGTSNAVDETVAQLKAIRLDGYFADFGGEGKLKEDGVFPDILRRYIDRLYQEVYFSVAFQSALVCGFFQVVERAEREALGPVMPRIDAFGEYVGSLNKFFVPVTMPQLRRLVGVFFEEVKEDRVADWQPVQTGESFREVVFRGEMKPDEWPKYRIVLLELWEPTDAGIKVARDAELTLCRKQAFYSLYEKKKRDLAVELKKREELLDDAERDQAFSRAYEAFSGFLTRLGATGSKKFTEADAKRALKADVTSKPVEDLTDAE